MLYIRQQDLHKEPVYYNTSYAIILSYCNISLEMLLKLSENCKFQFLTPLDNIGGEMSSTRIRHILQTRFRTLFYIGVVYLSTFKTYQNK